MRISRQPRGNHHEARYAVELLEGRRLLTGTVTANFNSSGVLIIQGDSQSNQIEVALRRTVGYTITGTNTAVTSSAPGATPVPGGVFIPPLSGPLTPGAVIMGNGDDIVTISGDFAFHDFSVDTGNGNDQVFANGNYGFGTFFVKTGNGDDRVTYTAEVFQVHSSIDTGNGNDVVALDGFEPFQGTHTFTTGTGNDLVVVNGFTPFQGTHTFDTGAGNDRVEIGGTDMFQGILNVLTGSGNDAVAITGLEAFITNLNFDGGSGTDTFTGVGAIIGSPSPLSILNFETVA